MASVEYLEKRVAGKEKEIAKLEAKMARIEKAAATNWEVNPYYYREEDMKYTARDLEQAREALENYKAKLEEETNKAASRNVETIIEFLNGWKKSVREYYIESVPAFLEAVHEKHEKYEEWRKCGLKGREYWDGFRKIDNDFNAKWGWLEDFMVGSTLDVERLDKVLENDANAKYDFIIERTVAKVGKITDASLLRIGKDGRRLNGFIKGEHGTVEVDTIGAGGYNIQRFHFRTLIKKCGK